MSNLKQDTLWVRLHLWIDDDLWQKLEAADISGKMPVLSKAFEILNIFYSTNRKLVKKIGNERSAGYPVPHPHDVHLRMPIYIYRWLKDSHAGQNVNAMAQIVRAILMYYLELVQKYGATRGMAIFTGRNTYRVLRAFVRLKRRVFTFALKPSELKAQLGGIGSLAYNFIREFVVLME